MAMHAFRRMREREAAESGGLCPQTLKKTSTVKPNGRNNDATAGGANANSYMTLAQADAYVEAMISSTDVSKWSTGTDDTRNRALAAAAQRLDRERFYWREGNQHAGTAMATHWCSQA